MVRPKSDKPHLSNITIRVTVHGLDILGYICAYDKSHKTLAQQGFWN